MSGVCTICNHKKRLRIDQELVQGLNMSEMTRKYGVGKDALAHHKKNHISRQLVQAWQKKEMDHAGDMLERIEGIVDRAEDIFTRNYEAKKDGVALKALSEQRSTFELLAKIAAHLHQIKAQEGEQDRAKDERENQEAVAEGLQLLTDDELAVLQNLQLKMGMYKKDAARFDCFDLGHRKVTTTIDGEEVERYVGTTSIKHAVSPRLKRTRFNKGKTYQPKDETPVEATTQDDPDIDPDGMVGYMDGKEIKSTPWSHNPMNPRRETAYPPPRTGEE